MKLITASALGLMLLWSTGIGAMTVNYTFECGTNSNAANCAQSEAYLNLAVSDTTLGASLNLTNSGPLISHTKTFWIDDDAGILDILSAVKTESSSVSYADMKLITQNVDGLDSFVSEGKAKTTPGATNGVTSGPGLNEWLTFDFKLTGTNTFNMLLAALNAGTFRVGVHVGTYSGSGSEKLSNLPISAVPVPAAVWLFGTALIGLVGFSKRRKAG